MERVQLENYGRLLIGAKDTLKNYKLEHLEITDAQVLDRSGRKLHPIASKTQNPSDTVDGTTYELTEDELMETDRYEVSDYERVRETLESGKRAWVYVKKPSSK